MERLKGFPYIAYPVHYWLIKLSIEYDTWMVQNRHSLLRLLLVETEKKEGMRIGDIGRPTKSVHESSRAQILWAAELIQVASAAGGRERMMYNVHRCMHMVLDDLKSICTSWLSTKTRNIVKLSCFPILAAYFCNVPEGKT